MSALAPAAPGQLGEQLDPQRLLGYLTDLGSWLTSRRAELDELDAVVQSSGHAAELTGDVRLGLMLWQAIKTRYDAMLVTWDSGRVGPSEREKLSSQIWARLDAPGVGAAGGGASGASGAGASGAMSGMSVPEACRMSDALTAQLRQRLQLDPSGSAVLVRLRDLRASVERLRDQVALEAPADAEAARAKLAALEARVQTVADKASRGGDVGGLLGPLELGAATFERDLIVGGAMRRQNAGRVTAATAAVRRLEEREARLRALVARTLAAVSPAPNYAVPDVEKLGPVPVTTDELDAYEAKLVRVGKAMDVVEASYSTALAEVETLRSELDAVAAGLRGGGASGLPGGGVSGPQGEAVSGLPGEVVSGTADPTLAAMLAAARGVLAQEPVQVDAARSLVASCRAYRAGTAPSS